MNTQLMLHIFKPLFNMEPFMISGNGCLLFSQIGNQKPWIRISTFLFWRSNHAGKIDSGDFTVPPVGDTCIPDWFVFFQCFALFSKQDSFSFVCRNGDISFYPNDKQHVFFQKKLEERCPTKASISGQEYFPCRIDASYEVTARR